MTQEKVTAEAEEKIRLEEEMQMQRKMDSKEIAGATIRRELAERASSYRFTSLMFMALRGGDRPPARRGRYRRPRPRRRVRSMASTRARTASPGQAIPSRAGRGEGGDRASASFARGAEIARRYGICGSDAAKGERGDGLLAEVLSQGCFPPGALRAHGRNSRLMKFVGRTTIYSIGTILLRQRVRWI